ncbi:AP-3 complex subunit mu-1 [Acrasis kona]|uniref:AP-3 complex subunit mu-1 n=1 Tax=Acrasis kona TaxID=1008807 RepID=A0AAW2YSM9_9EUKA
MSNHYIIHVLRSDVFFVGVVQSETPPLMVVELLNRLVEILTSYIGQVDDNSIKQNFVVLYQLLDEMIDNGFPITTELSLLYDLVKPPSNVIQSIANSVNSHVKSGGHGISPVPWRKLGIKYPNNEVFFDLDEEMNCIIDVNGNSLLCEVNAKINCNCKLSGMPDLSLTFKQPQMLEDVSFHPCVRYAKFEQDRTVSFVPPDGEFVLMTYRITNLPMAPIYCRPQLSFNTNNNSGTVNVMLGLRHTSGKPLEEVKVIIPLPCQLESHTISATVGSVAFDPVLKQLVWKVGKIDPQDKKTISCSGGVRLPDKSNVAKAGTAVLVDFKLGTVALSGVKVDAVNLKSETYKPYKGVRYQTFAGRFEVRTY